MEIPNKEFFKIKALISTSVNEWQKLHSRINGLSNLLIKWAREHLLNLNKWIYLTILNKQLNRGQVFNRVISLIEINKIPKLSKRFLPNQVFNQFSKRSNKRIYLDKKYQHLQQISLVKVKPLTVFLATQITQTQHLYQNHNKTILKNQLSIHFKKSHKLLTHLLKNLRYKLLNKL